MVEWLVYACESWQRHTDSKFQNFADSCFWSSKLHIGGGISMRPGTTDFITTFSSPKSLGVKEVFEIQGPVLLPNYWGFGGGGIELSEGSGTFRAELAVSNIEHRASV